MALLLNGILILYIVPVEGRSVYQIISDWISLISAWALFKRVKCS